MLNKIFIELSKFKREEYLYLINKHQKLHDFLKYTNYSKRKYFERELIIDSGVYYVKKHYRYKYFIKNHYNFIKNISRKDSKNFFVVPDYPVDMINLGHHNIFNSNINHNYYMNLNKNLIFSIQSKFENTESFINNYNILMNKIYNSKIRNSSNTLIGLGNLCLSKNKLWQKEFCEKVNLDKNFTYHIFAPNLKFLKIMCKTSFLTKNIFNIDTSKFTKPCSHKKIKKALINHNLFSKEEYQKYIIEKKNLSSCKGNHRFLYLDVYLERIYEIINKYSI